MDVEEEGEGEEDAATTAAKQAAKKIKAAATGKQDEDDDLAAYNLDAYDEEESKGAGESPPFHWEMRTKGLWI